MPRRKTKPSNTGFLHENHRRKSHLSRSEMIGCAETQAGRFLVTMDRDRKGRIFMKFEPWGWKINNNLQVLSRIRKIKKAGTNQHILVGDVNLMGYLFQMELTLQKLAKTKRKCFRIRFKEVF